MGSYEITVSIPEENLNNFVNEATMLFSRVRYDADKYQQVWNVTNQINMAIGTIKREERKNGQLGTD